MPIPDDTVDKIMALCGYTCSKCRKTRAHEIHHLDLDNSNHDIDNLMPLCANCHREIGCETPDCSVRRGNPPFARKFTPKALKIIRDTWYDIYNPPPDRAQIRAEIEELRLQLSELEKEVRGGENE